MLGIVNTPILAAVVLAALAAIVDSRTGRIPNALTLPAAALGLVVHAFSGRTELLSALVGLSLAGLVPFALFQATAGRAIGGGDVKLFAALGAWTGPFTGLRIELAAFVLLAAFSLVRLAFRGELLPVLGRSALLLARPVLPSALRSQVKHAPLTEVRMGPAIFAGTLATALADRLEGALPWLV